MPTDKRRIMLSILDDDVFRILGLNPDQHGATQIWGCLARYAAAVRSAGREIEDRLTREEWCMLADALNGCLDVWEYSGTPLSHGLLFIAELEDGQRLNGLGDKWLGQGNGDAGTRNLVRKIRKMSSVQHDAVAAAIRWFWSEAASDHGAGDDWWRVERRLRPREEVAQ